MSSTNRGGQRTPSDNYPTPSWTVHRLLEEVQFPDSGVWYEPCAGEGAIIQSVNQVLVDIQWWANEIRPGAVPLLSKQLPKERITVDDFRTLSFWSQRAARLGHAQDFSMHSPRPEDVSVVISNPPFRIAMDVINKALATFPQSYLVLLLRLNFWGSKERRRFLKTFAPDTYVLPNRPPFKPNGKTDSPEYGWFVWPPAPRQRSEGIITVLEETPLEVRKAARQAAAELM